MPRNHARLGTDLWSEETFRGLGVDDQWLYLFISGQPDLSRCGVADYRPTRWARMAGGMTDRRIRAAARRMDASRHLVLDEQYEQVLRRTYVRHDGLLAQPMVVAAMVSDFRAIASPKIRTAFLGELRRIWHLPALPDSERAGLLLVFGQAAQSDRVRKAIGSGLVEPLAEAIAEGSVEPFTEPFAQGLPEPVYGPFTQPPRAYAQAGGRPSSVSYSVSGSAAPAEPSTGPPASPKPKPGGDDEPPDPIVRARKRAGRWPDPAWSLTACRRVVQRAAHENSPLDADPGEHTQDAWDRLAALAALGDTRSPGRLLESAGWELAGRELTRMRADDGNRRLQLAEREARNRGQTGCEHGHLLGGDQCALCRTEARTA